MTLIILPILFQACLMFITFAGAISTAQFHTKLKMKDETKVLCTTKYNCEPEQYCHKKISSAMNSIGVCTNCLNCSKLMRYGDLCARYQFDCGGCLNGYEEVGEHCILKHTTQSPKVVGNKDLAHPATPPVNWLAFSIIGVVLLVIIIALTTFVIKKRRTKKYTNSQGDSLPLAESGFDTQDKSDNFSSRPSTPRPSAPEPSSISIHRQSALEYDPPPSYYSGPSTSVPRARCPFQQALPFQPGNTVNHWEYEETSTNLEGDFELINEINAEDANDLPHENGEEEEAELPVVPNSDNSSLSDQNQMDLDPSPEDCQNDDGNVLNESELSYDLNSGQLANSSNQSQVEFDLNNSNGYTFDNPNDYLTMQLGVYFHIGLHQHQNTVNFQQIENDSGTGEELSSNEDISFYE